MKFYFRYIFIFFIAFCFNFITVHAENICVYGEGTGSSWKKKITLDLSASNPFIVDKSPFLTDKPDDGIYVETNDSTFNGVKRFDNETYKNYWGDTIKYQFKANINNTTCDAKILYGIDKVFDKCPESIYVAYHTTNIGCFNDSGTNNIAFYTDDLSLAKSFLNFTEDDVYYSESHGEIPMQKKWDSVEHLWILEKNKDEDPSKINPTGCQTFEKYIEKMTEAAVHNDGSCDNNNEFDDLYSDLQEMCERYRSSTKYVDGSGKAKGCMSACTGLRDTVDIMCNQEKKVDIVAH